MPRTPKTTMNDTTHLIDVPVAAPAPQQPTPASEWNDEALYTLPSGKVARLKRPGVLAIASATNGANPISDAVLIQHMTVGNAVTSDEERAGNIRKNSAMYVTVAKLCFVSPRVVDAPDYDANQIAPADIDDVDLMFVYFRLPPGRCASSRALSSRLRHCAPLTRSRNAMAHGLRPCWPCPIPTWLGSSMRLRCWLQPTTRPPPNATPISCP